MTSTLQIPDIVRQYPEVKLPAGERVFSQGQECNQYTVIAAGKVRVLTRSPDGRELVLYYISPGEVCVLTSACLLENTRYPAEAITETPVSAFIIPCQEFDRLVAESAQFRQFVFNSFSHRLADLMAQLEQVALNSIDDRLLHYLRKHRGSDNHVRTTHQEIANHIGSAREVVSRHLKALEKQQRVKLGRGSIELLGMDD